MSESGDAGGASPPNPRGNPSLDPRAELAELTAAVRALVEQHEGLGVTGILVEGDPAGVLDAITPGATGARTASSGPRAAAAAAIARPNPMTPQAGAGARAAPVPPSFAPAPWAPAAQPTTFTAPAPRTTAIATPTPTPTAPAATPPPSEEPAALAQQDVADDPPTSAPPDDVASPSPPPSAAPSPPPSRAPSPSPSPPRSPSSSAPPLPPAWPDAPPLVHAPLDERRARLALLAEDVRACTRCTLHEGRRQTVFSRGDPYAELCFLGEGPGADEDQQGYPFVGASGQTLDRMIAAMGYRRDDVYICNIVKCRPPNNRKPTPEEMAACTPFLIGQLALIQPKVIVALGATAVQGLFDTTEGITSMRGKWKRFRGTIDVMPTFHPAYLLRQPSARREVWNDLKDVMRRLGKSPGG